MKIDSRFKVLIIFILLVIIQGCTPKCDAQFIEDDIDDIIDEAKEDTDTNKTKEESIEVGDSIQLGEYHGTPLYWDVVTLSEDGIAKVIASKIICYKCFDAAEIEYERYEDYNGSNYWLNSNLREWLNCNNDTVQYSTYPPVAEAVFIAEYAYSDEAGFLTNFTEEELAKIVPSEYRFLLNEYTYDLREGGTNLIVNDGCSDYMDIDFSTYAYKNATDLVYLLSIEEVNELKTEFGYDIYKDSLTDGRGDFLTRPYWLRTPDGNYPTQVFRVESDGTYGAPQANMDSGVLPVMHVNVSGFSSEQAIKFDLDFEVIEGDEEVEIDDMEVEIKKLAITQDTSQSGDLYGLIVGVKVDYSGEGTCNMSDVIEVAIYSSDLSYQYRLDSESRGLNGSQDYRDVSIESDEKAYGQFWFEAESWTIDPNNIRIFILVSDELFELVEYDELFD